MTLTQTLDKLITDQERRHAWISRAATQIERWRAEDAANGDAWEINSSSTERGGESVNGSSASK